MLSQSLPATVHGEFASSDATGLNEANSRLTLYQAGTATSLTLGSSDHFVVCSVTVSSAATNALVQLYDGADATVDAGEEVLGGIVATNTSQTVNLSAPHVCQKGTYPKVKASAAGNVRVQVRGVVVRVGS